MLLQLAFDVMLTICPGALNAAELKNTLSLEIGDCAAVRPELKLPTHHIFGSL
jgi:hypothetical protein